jgi:hypothetical protein
MADETYTKADLDAAVKEAIEEATGGLKQKVEDLIGDNKKLKQQVRSASEIKPEEVAAIEKERDDLAEKLKVAEKAAKDATATAEKATKALETESAFTQKLLIQDGLKSALIAAGVKDEDHLDFAVAKFSQGASVKVDGENRVALYGDKPMADAIKEWAGTDAGKKFVAAPANSGGGAPGGKGEGGGSKTATRAEFDAMDHSARGSFAKEGGKVVEA